jgi:hypothetical protein
MQFTAIARKNYQNNAVHNNSKKGFWSSLNKIRTYAQETKSITKENLQVPRPPQPLLMIVIFSALTIISFTFYGS